MEFKPKYRLDDWQVEARDAWLASQHPTLGPRHGIADVYTGAGKTFLAFGCMVAARKLNPRLKFAVVCPNAALAHQWVQELRDTLTLPREAVGLQGDGYGASFDEQDVVVYVLATARGLSEGRSQLARDAEGYEVMLVVDECHNSGARQSSRIYDVTTWARLGLSATAQRTSNDACDEDGRPLPLDRQPQGMALGPVFFRFSLKDGIARGMLPRFEVHHHAVHLTEAEIPAYEDLEERIQNRKKKLEEAGGNPEKYRAHLNGANRRTTPPQRAAAEALENAYHQRKMFLYRASERLRVARMLVAEAWASGEPPSGAMLFNEIIGEGDDQAAEDQEVQAFGATILHERLADDARRGMLPLAPSRIRLEHGKLPSAARKAAIDDFKAGQADVLVTVKALQQGIDVPRVSMGVSVASTSSARQRIQTMGRILRLPRGPDGARKRPEDVPVKHLHMIYVDVPPDTRVYTETDWNAETGETRNHWWTWPVGGDKEVGTRLEPQPEKSEQWAWDAVKDRLPAVWDGPRLWPGSRYTLRHDGVRKVSTGERVTNDSEVRALREGLERGPFDVTPELHVVVKWNKRERRLYAYGRLTAPLLTAEGPGAVTGPPDADAGPPQPEGHVRTQPATSYDREAAEAEDLAAMFGGSWYELLQHACAAVAAGELDTLRACRRRAVDQGGTRSEHVVAFADAVLAGEPTAADRARLQGWARTETDASLNRQQYPALLALAGQAHAAGVPALVHLVAGAFKLRAAGKAGKARARMLALVNAMHLLAGAGTAIVADAEGD
jgi:superfamily II DNA or RNA helicase